MKATAASGEGCEGPPPPLPPPRTSSLVLRRSPDSAAARTHVAAETGATSLYFNHLNDPILLVRDNEEEEKPKFSLTISTLLSPFSKYTPPQWGGGDKNNNNGDKSVRKREREGAGREEKERGGGGKT